MQWLLKFCIHIKTFCICHSGHFFFVCVMSPSNIMVFICVPTVNMSYLAKFGYWEACWLTFEVLYLITGNFALELISTVSLCT